ncbi:MAG: hypothetical protein MI806_10960 [Minwuiales bacterium]|nr:hypothetical protein [Minwuiales bacterium]
MSRWAAIALVCFVAFFAEVYTANSRAWAAEHKSKAGVSILTKCIAVCNFTPEIKPQRALHNAFVFLDTNGTGKKSVHAIFGAGIDDSLSIRRPYVAGRNFCKRMFGKNAVRPIANIVGGSLSVIPDYDLVSGRHFVDLLSMKMRGDGQVSSQLALSSIAGDCIGCFGGSSRLDGSPIRIARSFQRFLEQHDRPNADHNGNETSDSHGPLSNGVSEFEKAYPLKEGLIRIGIAIFLVFPIMILAANFSASDWGKSAWRFYGGLVGGLVVWVGFAVLIIGWPIFQYYGVLP